MARLQGGMAVVMRAVSEHDILLEAASSETAVDHWFRGTTIPEGRLYFPQMGGKLSRN